MMVEFDEHYWAKAIANNLQGMESIDEQDLCDVAYEMLDIWAIENLGLLQILMETAKEELKKIGFEVKE